VRGFVKAWGSKPIDALCLNAGLAPNTRDPQPKCVGGMREVVVVVMMMMMMMMVMMYDDDDDGDDV
jgi:hypothetical protein